MSWLTHEEAIRSAFEYRWRGTKSQDPILLTDFDMNDLRVIEVRPGAWDDVTAWSARERPMTDTEFSEINAYIRRMPEMMGLGTEVMQEQGRPVRIRGYIKRPYKDGPFWNATIDIDRVLKQIDAYVSE